MAGNVTARKSRKFSDNIKTSIFLSPALVILLIFFITPMLLTVMYSFTNLSLTGTQAARLEFVGFDNFVRMFNDTNLYPRFPKNYNVVGGTTPKVLYNCDCFFVISPTRTALPGFSNASMTSNSSSNSCIV